MILLLSVFTSVQYGYGNYYRGHINHVIKLSVMKTPKYHNNNLYLDKYV